MYISKPIAFVTLEQPNAPEPSQAAPETIKIRKIVTVEDTPYIFDLSVITHQKTDAAGVVHCLREYSANPLVMIAQHKAAQVTASLQQDLGLNSTGEERLPDNQIADVASLFANDYNLEVQDLNLAQIKNLKQLIHEFNDKKIAKDAAANTDSLSRLSLAIKQEPQSLKQDIAKHARRLERDLELPHCYIVTDKIVSHEQLEKIARRCSVNFKSYIKTLWLDGAELSNPELKRKLTTEQRVEFANKLAPLTGLPARMIFATQCDTKQDIVNAVKSIICENIPVALDAMDETRKLPPAFPYTTEEKNAAGLNEPLPELAAAYEKQLGLWPGFWPVDEGLNVALTHKTAENLHAYLNDGRALSYFSLLERLTQGNTSYAERYYFAQGTAENWQTLEQFDRQVLSYCFGAGVQAFQLLGKAVPKEEITISRLLLLLSRCKAEKDLGFSSNEHKLKIVSVLRLIAPIFKGLDNLVAKNMEELKVIIPLTPTATTAPKFSE